MPSFLAFVLAAALLTIPVAAPPALAHHGKAAEHKEMAMQKTAKKATKKPKAKKKEEYMRAVPSR